MLSTFKHPVYKQPNIFVITNRQSDNSATGLTFINRVKEDPSLSFFRVNASNADTLLLNPLDSMAFIHEISGIKTRDWVLFVHGDSKTFEEATIRGLNIQNLYDVNVIVFAWPSKDIHLHGLRNYFTSYENVPKSLNHFYSVLKTVSQWRSDSTKFLAGDHVSLFLHSLGNYYLYYMGNKKIGKDTLDFKFDNIIINAAAVDQSNHADWVEQLNFQKRIFITSNKHDFNLNGLKFFTSHGSQLGQRVKRPYANNAIYLNFNRPVGFRIPTGYTHTYFIGKVPQKKKNVHQLYYEMLHGQMPNLADKSRFRHSNKAWCKFMVR